MFVSINVCLYSAELILKVSQHERKCHNAIFKRTFHLSVKEARLFVARTFGPRGNQESRDLPVLVPTLHTTIATRNF